MALTARPLVIDARPRGPRGPLSVERVQGRSVLDHLLDLSLTLSTETISIHVGPDDPPLLSSTLAARPAGRFVLTDGPPPEGAAVLRTDRLYDPSRLRRVLRKGDAPELAVIWRLDAPQALDVAEDELVRRQSYQPLGRFWALGPARRLARTLAPTRVRPNAVTLAASGLFLAAAALVAFGTSGGLAGFGAALALALALILDTADGHLARLQGTTSNFGRGLDAWLDELGDMALHAAIAWSMYVGTGNVAWLLTGMAYGMGKYIYTAGTLAWSEGEGQSQSLTQGSRASTSRVRAMIRMIGHADVRWHLWIVLAAWGRLDLALAAYAVYFPARAALGVAGKAVRLG